MTTWRNWAGNVTASPAEVRSPSSTEEVSSIVRAAAELGLRVKAVGAGHSFTPIATTDGVQLTLRNMDRVVSHDRDAGIVRVQAGITLHALNPKLAALGLALPNMGDVDPQSLAGAISTGTHGTGGRLQGIAAGVVGLQLVTGSGEIVEVDAAHPWFGAARVGLGALGIITEVTLQCVPGFLLHAREEVLRLPEVLDNVDAFVETNDHLDFYWFPHTEKALVKRNNRVDPGTDRRPVGRFRSLLDDEILSNGGLEVVNRLASWFPRATPRINAFSASALTSREFVDDSYKVFVSPRRVRFRESEFALPREALGDVVAELQQWFRMSGQKVSFPIEVRFAAADDLWLSTGFERDNVYVAVHQYHRVDPATYFDAAQQIFTAHDGRPHWGKMHDLDASYLRGRYRRFDDFLKVRDETDPGRTFTNAYLQRVLDER